MSHVQEIINTRTDRTVRLSAGQDSDLSESTAKTEQPLLHHTCRVRASAELRMGLVKVKERSKDWTR